MANENRSFYNEILTEHNLRPLHKYDICDAAFQHEGINPSCGDDIILKLNIKDGVITDGSFLGDGCAISQASTDIMMDMILGKTVKEARHLSELFLRMIKGETTDEEVEELEEAGALQDISHMPARVKCAVLAWHTLDEMLPRAEKDGTAEAAVSGECCH